MLEVRKVSKDFGGLRALSNVSLKVQAGSVTALIGPNGAGKSTLFDIVSGFQQSTSGGVFFEEKLISGLSPNNIVKKGISRTFQLIKLFMNMTVLENVMTGKHLLAKADPLSILIRLPRVKAEEATIRQQSVELLEAFSLNEKADEPAANLPAGQQRLLELVRALAVGPKLVLMDEVAAGLNRSEKEALMRGIRGLKRQGITVFLIEHDIEFVGKIADWVIVLNFGVKIAEGTVEAIRTEKGVIEAYLGSELEQ